MGEMKKRGMSRMVVKSVAESIRLPSPETLAVEPLLIMPLQKYMGLLAKKNGSE